MINKIIGSAINYYKIDTQKSQTNIYGQSTNKTFFQNIKIMGLIEFEDYSTQNSQFGYNIFNKLKIRLDRQYMSKQIELYPCVGDIIQWNNSYYDISSVIQNQFIGGQTQQQNNWSIICQCILTKKSKLFIESLVQYTSQFDQDITSSNSIRVSKIKNEQR